ncbi:MAG: hypothetical protein Q8N04_09565 [Nitrospira sp.]|nr:hypothetical protein [Nitrospira sp.]
MTNPDAPGYTPCPLDAGPIPLIGEHRTKSQPLIRFYYCRFCDQVFAFTATAQRRIGEGLVASFRRQSPGGKWELLDRSGAERLGGIAQAAIATLKPNSDGTL